MRIMIANIPAGTCYAWQSCPLYLFKDIGMKTIGNPKQTCTRTRVWYACVNANRNHWKQCVACWLSNASIRHLHWQELQASWKRRWEHFRTLNTIEVLFPVYRCDHNVDMFPDIWPIRAGYTADKCALACIKTVIPFCLISRTRLCNGRLEWT